MPTRASLKENINKPKIDDSELETETQVNEGRNKSFSLEELRPIWQGILLQKEQAQKSTEIQIFQGEFTLKDEIITVAISNEALLPIFEKIKFDLINDLRNKLENDKIIVNARVVEIENGKMRYTDSEKFEYLKEKHPLLQKLQDKLHLDPEF
jgi:DNA polymerase-3 subunit gamma/tau